MSMLDEMLKKPTKDLQVIVQEVLDDKWGRGAERKERLTKAGYDYEAIQEEVNKRVIESFDKYESKYSDNRYPQHEYVGEVIDSVIKGEYGSTPEEWERNLQKAGYNTAVIDEVKHHVQQYTWQVEEHHSIKKKETKQDAVEMLLTVVNLLESGQYSSEDCIIDIDIKSKSSPMIDLSLKGTNRGFKGFLRRKGLIE